MLNKKSQVEDWLPLILIIIVLLFVLLYISYAQFGSERTAQEIIGKKIVVKDSQDILLNYLKSPINLEKFPDANIADALSYYSIREDVDLLLRLQAATNSYFSKSSLETDYSSYSLEISYAGKELVIESEKSRTNMVAREFLSATAIPTPYKDDLIQLKLFLVTTRFVSK